MIAKRSTASKLVLVLLVALVAVFLVGAVADAHRVPGCRNDVPLQQNPHCAEGHHGDNPGECSDGVDNDGDGLVDGDDPDCGTEPPPPPPDTCNDGEDNDDDGVSDGDDAECQDPEDGVEDGSDEPVTTCNDGEDNDDDGVTDGDDAECQDPEDGVEDGSDEPPVPACSDGEDNDGDTLVDGDDPGCSGPDDTDETDEPVGEPTCGDPDGDGVDHSSFDPTADETGLVSSILHGADQALPAPVGGDQGVVAEVNCALVAGTLGL